MRILPKLELFILSACMTLTLCFNLFGHWQEKRILLTSFYDSSETEILHFEKVMDAFFIEAKANVLFLEELLAEVPLDDTLFSLVGLTGEGKVLPSYTSETDLRLLSLFDGFLKRIASS